MNSQIVLFFCIIIGGKKGKRLPPPIPKILQKPIPNLHPWPFFLWDFYFNFLGYVYPKNCPPHFFYAIWWGGGEN
jgi:hypothetical protein